MAGMLSPGLGPSSAGRGDTPPIFAMGEKVLVPHTDKHYEAKILKTEFRSDGVWYYFLHYTGEGGKL